MEDTTLNFDLSLMNMVKECYTIHFWKSINNCNNKEEMYVATVVPQAISGLLLPPEEEVSHLIWTTHELIHFFISGCPVQSYVTYISVALKHKFEFGLWVYDDDFEHFLYFGGNIVYFTPHLSDEQLPW